MKKQIGAYGVFCIKSRINQDKLTSKETAPKHHKTSEPFDYHNVITNMNFQKAKLIEQALEKLQTSGYSEKTKDFYLDWIYRFLFSLEEDATETFCDEEIDKFITFLETDCLIAKSTINQAKTAIHFFYKEVLQTPFTISHRRSSKKNTQSPVILSREEVKNVLNQLHGDKGLMAGLMYGCGLRLTECLHLRVKDLNKKKQKINVCDVRDGSSRNLDLPRSLIDPIHHQLNKVKLLYDENLSTNNFIGALLPETAQTKGNCQATSKDLSWQFIFPSKYLYRIENEKLVQQPVSESYLQKGIKEALTICGVNKTAGCHTFRHSFATHLIEDGYDIHLVQKILGLKCIQSTLIYKKLARQDKASIISPLDKLFGPNK
ncbi:integron integrase [Gaoshiqia sediminis]|uniref:Integron integrase n=1 Tax=Gaoshiqia sediminis TaxID=2986998 RepID=A0AA41YCK6_9BACT|nr:integron integrase [Gaoshiqia sediminis]MCW0484028.1 integron integrase [Gaoshiqia sediminis]